MLKFTKEFAGFSPLLGRYIIIFLQDVSDEVALIDPPQQKDVEVHDFLV